MRYEASGETQQDSDRLTPYPSRLTYSFQSLFRQFNRFHHRLGFIAGLFIFVLWIGISDNSGPGLNEGLVLFYDNRTNVDAHVHVAGETEVAHRAGIGTAPRGLEFIDDLHRSDLGRTGNSTGRETGSQH